MVGMTKATPKGRLSGSAEAAPGLGEGVFIGGDGLVHGLVRGKIVVFPLKLPVEPAGQIAQRLGHDLFGILSHVLPGRAVTLDRDRHTVFVVIVAAMAGLGAKLVEIAPLHRLKRIGDTVKLGVLRRVGPDPGRSILPIGIIGFKAGTVALAPEAPEPDAGLLPRISAIC